MYASRSSPSPADAYAHPGGPGVQQPISQAPYGEQMTAPRPFRSSSSANSSTHSADDSSSSGDTRPPPAPHGYPYAAYGSSGSLPRYQSQQQLPQNPSPLGPSRQPLYRDGASYSSSSRLSAYGNGNFNGAPGPHPLSNAMYMDSSPTLAGSEHMSPSDEKMRLGAGDALGNYSVPPSNGAHDTTNSTQGGPYRRGPLKATGLTAFYRALSGANLADSGKDERHIKLPRLGYLDGLKFFAAWLVLNGTFFDAAIEDNDYTAIQRSSPLYLVRSSGLGITFLLMLSGRSLVTPLWDVPTPSSNAAAKTNTALISWARLTRAMIVRTFRFVLPVISIVALQWGLSSSGRTSNSNAVGMDEPYWGLVQNFAGFCTLVFNLFTFYEYDTLAGQTFAGNLWTNPWFFQSSFAVYVIHMMLGNLSSNRYWIYAVLALCSWCTYNYFFAAILGLILADMHAHGHLHRIRAKWPAWQRLTLHLCLIVIACVFQFVPVLRDNVNSGMSVINVQDHNELAFCDAIFAFGWLFAIETSGLAQNILGNIVMRTLGKFSAGIYLLAPAITFTIVPDVALSLHNNGSTASTVLGVSWLVLFIVVLALSIAFHFVVELPSKMLGEVVVEILETSDQSWRLASGGVKDGKLLKRNPGGGAKLSK
ncbi:hypothetical protein OIV83_000471 [Microbotryomycetes sp. JL201]|nr:hypothetical protein OIV83_000471 [Microbotryomycetes sp. JL201]